MAAEAALAPMAAADAAEAVLTPMAAADAAEAVLAPVLIAAAPPVAADGDAVTVVAVLAPTPIAVLQMAADAAETVSIAATPAADDEDAETFAAPADEAVLVQMPVASPPVTANDAEAVVVQMPVSAPSPMTVDDVVPTAVISLSSPEQTSSSVTDDAEDEEVPSQSEIDKAYEYIDALIPKLDGDQKSCGMAIGKNTEDTDHPWAHSMSDDKQPMAAFDEDVQKSETRQSYPSDRSQRTPWFDCDRNEECHDDVADFLGMSPRRCTRRTTMDCRWLMRDKLGEDMYMGSRFCRNCRGIDISEHSLIMISDDESGQSDESEHIDDGDASHFYNQFDNHHIRYGRCHEPFDNHDIRYGRCRDPFDHHDIGNGRCRGRANRRGYPCHCNERRNRNNGYPFHPRFKLYNHMPYPMERWHSPKPDHDRMSGWSSPKPDHEKEKYNVGAGLLNPYRWTCFLNCILQCMVHTVPLVLKLQEADHPDPCPRASIGFCCYCSLKLHANESIKCSGSSFYPLSFVDRLSSISPDFERGVQQDAQEFLRCLLDKLDEASVAPRTLEEPSSTEEGGVAKEVFGGRLKSQLHCRECSHCSDRYEPFLDLSLEVNMVATLVDALESFTKVELIEDVMCDGCKTRVNMEKHLKIEQAPEVLVIHLKRFLNSGHNISKIWDKVEYTLELDIDPFMCSVGDTPQKYDLYGVVEHLGTYARGHYVCYIRSSEDDWYKFDDANVYRCSEANVLDIRSYLLFYVKQGSSQWFSSLLEKEKKIALDGSEDQGPDDFLKDKEESMPSDGKDSSGSLAKPAEENEIGPSFRRDADGSTLSDAPEQVEGSCSLGGISGGTEEISCLTGSGDENGHADGFTYSLEEKKDDNPQGSLLHMKEMEISTQGDNTVTRGGSSGKNDNTFRTVLHEDQNGGSSGAPSGLFSSKKKATVESSNDNHIDEHGIGNSSIRKGKCEQL
ncbi:hypothetical protein EJB05_23266, partial [Eragrostis curvula]